MHESFNEAFRSDIEALTGGRHAVFESVKRRVSQLTRTRTTMWIGIASNGVVDGCRARWNAKYKAEGMQHMAAVYRTNSERFRRDLETDLVEFYKNVDDVRIDNVARGGAGREGTPPFVVYVAWY